MNAQVLGHNTPDRRAGLRASAGGGAGASLMGRSSMGPSSMVRGYSLIEVTIVSVVIIILTALVLVAIGPMVRSVRNDSERQFLRSLVVATEGFRQRFGGIPPLVNDQTPLVQLSVLGSSVGTPRWVVNPLFSPGGSPETFMRYVDGPGVSRSSTFSPTIFLLGVLPERIDGVQGPGMTSVDPATGAFNIGGPQVQPFFDTNSVRERIARTNLQVPQGTPGETFQFLRDRWGNPVRYYRWMPARYVAAGLAPASVYQGWRRDGSRGPLTGNTGAALGEVYSYNVPVLLGNPWANADLRGASFAYVSAGADGFLDENLPPDEGVNRDNLVELGQ
jgi:type II secretory pathway pseudopilin PulG